MTAPDDSSLLHAHAPYDPTKAHQYYEEHKHLKGRTPGAGYQPKGAGPHGLGPPIGLHPSSHPQPSKQQLQSHADKRVKELTDKLNHLKAVLARLTQEAQKRSGAKVSPTAPASKTSKTAKKTPALTPAQKARNHRNYLKNKAAQQKSPSAQAQSLETQIKAVHTQIANIRKTLKESVHQARQHAQGLSQTKTAPKGR